MEVNRVRSRSMADWSRQAWQRHSPAVLRPARARSLPPLNGILRLLQSCGGDIHALAEQIENGGMSEKYREEIRAQIKEGP